MTDLDTERCRPLTDLDGHLIALVHGMPLADDDRDALTDLVLAAHRMMLERPDLEQVLARQAAAREQIAERNRRLLGS